MFQRIYASRSKLFPPSTFSLPKDETHVTFNLFYMASGCCSEKDHVVIIRFHFSIRRITRQPAEWEELIFSLACLAFALHFLISQCVNYQSYMLVAGNLIFLTAREPRTRAREKIEFIYGNKLWRTLLVPKLGEFNSWKSSNVVDDLMALKNSWYHGNSFQLARAIENRERENVVSTPKK